VDVVIDARFTGPPQIANGGYACAVVAAGVDGPAEVTLHRPVPVARPLMLSTHGRQVTLHGPDGQLLVEAAPIDSLDITAPPPVSVADASAAMDRCPAHDLGERMFPCFVCSPNRADGLGVFPGPVTDRDLAAALWTPDAAMAAGDGRMPAELTWAVLDCTGSWAAVLRHDPALALLGQMSTDLVDAPRAGQTYVTVGRAGPRDGRRLPATAALFTRDGELLASARLLCIEPKTHSG
jgi:hypothetical protein